MFGYSVPVLDLLHLLHLLDRRVCSKTTSVWRIDVDVPMGKLQYVHRMVPSVVFYTYLFSPTFPFTGTSLFPTIRQMKARPGLADGKQTDEYRKAGYSVIGHRASIKLF